MTESLVLAPSRGLRAAATLGLAIWAIVAAFPLVWIAVMSIKSPLDAYSPNPLNVLIGPETRRAVGGLSIADFLICGLIAAGAWKLRRGLAWTRPKPVRQTAGGTGWNAAMSGAALLVVVALVVAAPFLARVASARLGDVPTLAWLVEPRIGATLESYRSVWIDNAFYRQFFNSMYVTAGVVTISLTVGTLAAYGFARRRSSLAFWLLMAALMLRAMPHSVLVAGYLPAFMHSRELLTPLWDSGWAGPLLKLFSDRPPSLYGQPLAVISVLVAINQPFTIWMLRSFFAAIPVELDEAAQVDGCTHFSAFRLVILPVMWPGVITTGLFSFLLAYNDYLVTALLLDAQSLTMVPAISLYLASENTAQEQLQAIAAAVSITAPLFLLVLVFQKRLVSGLMQGAVKG